MHIDVYCTGSESSDDDGTSKQLPTRHERAFESDESDESNESNTSTCYAAVKTTTSESSGGARIRHVRKKSGLPRGLSARRTSKPLLSYRISADELAEAMERRRRCADSIGTLASDAVDDELFRELALTDSSARSPLLADSDCSSDARDKTWRSPEEERLRLQMLEQRKQQWRAAKSSVPQNLNLNEDVARKASDRPVTRTNTLKCPVVDRVVPNTKPPVDAVTRDAFAPGAGPLKRFGRHAGPARNPDCRCAHCVEHFARARSLKERAVRA